MGKSVEHEAGIRLHEFLKEHKVAAQMAADALKMRLPQLKRILEGKIFRMHWILRITTAFPSLNPTWLITGQGDMLMPEEITTTQDERKSVELLDEARNLRNKVQELPTKRKAELCGQVIEIAERLLEDNQERRERLIVVQKNANRLRYILDVRSDLS